MRTGRLGWALAVAFAAATSASCGLLDPYGDVQNELDANYDKWLAHRPRSYQYRLTQLCFCAPAETRPYLVRVSDEQVVETKDAETGVAPPKNYASRSVIDLFAVIRYAISRNPDHIEVTYDPVIGYPAKIKVDYEERAADDELEVRAEGLVGL